MINPNTSKPPARRVTRNDIAANHSGHTGLYTGDSAGFGCEYAVHVRRITGNDEHDEQRRDRQDLRDHERDDRDVERDEHPLGDSSCPRLAEDHRQRVRAVGRVPRDLVDVLAHEHGRAEQRVRQRREHDRAGNGAGRRVVDAADHERAPHDEHGRLAEAVLLQAQRRRGVRGSRAGSRRARTRRSASPAPTVSTIMIARHIALTTSAHPASPLARDHARQHGVRRVEVARVVLAVGADLEVEEVVHQVVGHVREHDADRREREPSPRDVGVAVDREQARDRGRDQRHREHAGAGQVEPLRHRVEPARRRVRRGEDVLPVADEARRRRPAPPSASARTGCVSTMSRA